MQGGGRPRLILDVSPVMDQPLTGVGYAALYLARAFLAKARAFDVILFAARARHTPVSAFPFMEGYARKSVIPGFRRLKLALWPRIEWPPIEWFAGRATLVHGLFHDLPASRGALRVATIHDLSFLRFPETHTRETISAQSRLVEHCARRADGLVTVSQCCKDEMVERYGFPEERVHVVPNGVSLEEFSAPVEQAVIENVKARLGIHGSYFIYVGTLEPRKNIPRLIEAHARLYARRGDCPQLLLVGKMGWKPELVTEALRKYAASGGVVHAGYLPREEMVQALKGAVACVYPSCYEGFGMPVLEAMAAGVPVLASRADALMEVSGGTCMHVEADNEEALELGIEALLDDREGAMRLAEKGRLRAETMTWNRSADRLADVYRSIIEAGRR